MKCRWFDICEAVSDTCQEAEECDLRTLLQKCFIVKKESQDEKCDILGWKMLIPKGFACCLVKREPFGEKLKMKCVVRTKLKMLIEKYGGEIDPKKLGDSEKEEITDTIRKLAPQSPNFLKIEIEKIEK